MLDPERFLRTKISVHTEPAEVSQVYGRHLAGQNVLRNNQGQNRRYTQDFKQIAGRLAGEFHRILRTRDPVPASLNTGLTNLLLSSSPI